MGSPEPAAKPTFDHLFENLPEPPVDEQVATALSAFLLHQDVIERAAEVDVRRGLRVTVRPEEIVVKAAFVDSTSPSADILGELATALFLAARDLNPDWRYRDEPEPLN